MISQLSKQDGERLLQAAKKFPALGARMAAEWKILEQNPAMPYRFYKIGTQGFLELSGGTAVICGNPESNEELEEFIQFVQPGILLSEDFCPKGWQSTRCLVMEFTENQPLAFVRAEAVVHPSAMDIVSLLEGKEYHPGSSSRLDGVYADICVRRNYGAAEIIGIEKTGKLIATAGIYAAADGMAYLGGVQTSPGHQKKGYASGLVAALCEKYANNTLVLLCEEKRKGFYEKLGFIYEGKTVQLCVAKQPDSPQVQQV